MPAGVLAMWLFVAADAMFFVGMLGSFVVLESAGDQHQLFVRSSQMLSRWIGLAGMVSLVFSSALLRRSHWIAVVSSLVFVLSQSTQWWMLQHKGVASWDNNFFGFYFLVSAVICLQLIVGGVALVKFKPAHIYCHFSNALGMAMILVLYFVQ